MNNVTLSWEHLWLYHQRAEKEIQDDILRQLDLENFLPLIPVSARQEVLRCAPQELKDALGRTIPLTRHEEHYRKELIRIFRIGEK